MRSLFPDCLNTAKTFLLAAAASLGGSVLAAFGGADVWLSALACTMGADYLTGLLLALVWKRSPKTENGAASSQAGLKGLFKKGAMFLHCPCGPSTGFGFQLKLPARRRYYGLFSQRTPLFSRKSRPYGDSLAFRYAERH